MDIDLESPDEGPVRYYGTGPVAEATSGIETALCADHEPHAAHDYPLTDPEWKEPPAWHCPGRTSGEA